MGLTLSALRSFEREGFVVVRNCLSPSEDLQPIIDEYAEVLDRVAVRLHEMGEIASAYADLPFDKRAIAITKDKGFLDPQPFDISFPTGADLTPETEFHFGPAAFALLRNPRLLDAVESIIGPEITSNPIQHVRIKVPERYIDKDRRGGLGGTTVWHQDNGVAHEEADNTEMLTVWFPLTEASERSGCLTVVPGSFRGGLQPHCPVPGRGSEIPEALIPGEKVQSVPMSPGDVLFMHRRCMHASLSNLSDHVRWSLDIRYHPTGSPSGRSFLPGFVARSRSNSSSELQDHAEWRQSWLYARDKLLASVAQPKAHRWDGKHELCA